MATLDTTRLIQPAPTLLPQTATTQPKPVEGFHRVLEDEAFKVGNPETQPKPSVSRTRAAREALQSSSALLPAAKRPNEASVQLDQEPAEASPAVKHEAAPAGARNEAHARMNQRKKGDCGSAPEATDGLVEVESEPAPRQVLPSETAEEGSGSSGSIPKEDAEQTTENQASASIVDRTASAATLLASLPGQTTGDPAGTQIAVQVQPRGGELSVVVGLPTSAAIDLAGRPSTGSAAWMSLETSSVPDRLDVAAPSEDVSALPTDPAAGTMEASTPVLARALNLATGTITSAKQLLQEPSPSEQVVSGPSSVPDVEQRVFTVQMELAPQDAVQSANGQKTDPLAATGQPAVVEEQKKRDRNQFEPTEKEELPEMKATAELLTSRALFQPGVETAAENTPQKDAFSSNQQDANPQDAEIVRRLKSVVTAHKETSRAQPVVPEVQEARGNVTPEVAEVALSFEKHGKPAEAPIEAFKAAAGAETSSSVLRIAEVTGSAGAGEPAGKVAGTSHATASWHLIEKAQVVSQIVERAHLLGKNQSELIVVLKPEFLGKVNLHAARIDNQLITTIMAESASVKQMLESQLSSLQAAFHEQGLPVAKVEVVQGNDLGFADLGAGHSSSQQHLETGQSPLLPAFTHYKIREESAEAIPEEALIYTPSTSKSLNLLV